MPSKESQILSDVYSTISSRQAARPNMEVAETRTLFLDVDYCGTEPADVTYENVDAGGIPALWVKPINASKDRVILYFHGGGFVLMGPGTHRKMVGHFAKAANARALLLDYRLAPENLFPAQVEDCVKGYRWLLDQGIKPENIATAGDSAGGNLAFSAVLKIKEEGLSQPAAVVGFSPWLDMEFKSDSLERNAKTDLLVQKALLQGMFETVSGGKALPNDPLINPLAADLKGFPPLFVVCGTWETLQDDSVRLVELAKKAGVDATLVQTEGMQHVHVFMAGKAPEADNDLAKAGKFLQENLGK